MAPFGRKFLKTRLKNRSEGKDAELGKEIQVWVRQEEKTVCGLTKHTRCADVVQALLEDQGASGEAEVASPSEYYLLERWKGFERALPPLTRILRLWMEWGDEQPFVQFVLVRSHDYRPRIGRPPREPQPGSEVADQAPAQYIRTLPVDRQKRMVRKAFRKLEKIRERERAPPGDGERVSSLVQLIISQDRAIREQAKRMRELDLEIERAEWRLGPAFEDIPPSLTNGADRQQPEGGVEHLERQLERHRDLIERLSYDIDAEMRSVCSPGGGDELELRTPASEGPELGVSPDAAAAEELGES
ncbi:hypothetical protein GJAV_G00270710 [Gymnothorax javanicus]|nr:hypothetical protein GJAV_G00270710 [Gymnothorax javanicus]